MALSMWQRRRCRLTFLSAWARGLRRTGVSPNRGVNWGEISRGRASPMRMVSTNPGTSVLPEIEESTRTRRVPPYNVILLNDDHHSMPFVMEVLIKALGCTKERAFEFMLEAHTSGRAV